MVIKLPMCSLYRHAHTEMAANQLSMLSLLMLASCILIRVKISNMEELSLTTLHKHSSSVCLCGVQGMYQIVVSYAGFSGEIQW